MIAAASRPKQSSIRAVVTRADGRVEDLGLIAFWHRNAIIRCAVNFYIRLKERKRA